MQTSNTFEPWAEDELGSVFGFRTSEHVYCVDHKICRCVEHLVALLAFKYSKQIVVTEIQKLKQSKQFDISESKTFSSYHKYEPSMIHLRQAIEILLNMHVILQTCNANYEVITMVQLFKDLILLLWYEEPEYLSVIVNDEEYLQSMHQRGNDLLYLWKKFAGSIFNYLHIGVAHAIEIIKEHGSLVKYQNQIAEKSHDLDKGIMYRKIQSGSISSICQQYLLYFLRKLECEISIKERAKSDPKIAAFDEKMTSAKIIQMNQNSRTNENMRTKLRGNIKKTNDQLKALLVTAKIQAEELKNNSYNLNSSTTSQNSVSHSADLNASFDFSCISAETDLHKFTVVKLKAMCKQLQIVQTGNKADIVTRLLHEIKRLRDINVLESCIDDVDAEEEVAEPDSFFAEMVNSYVPPSLENNEEEPSQTVNARVRPRDSDLLYNEKESQTIRSSCN